MKAKPKRPAKRAPKAAGNGTQAPKPKLIPIEELARKIFKIDRTVGILSRR